MRPRRRTHPLRRHVPVPSGPGPASRRLAAGRRAGPRPPARSRAGPRHVRAMPARQPQPSAGRVPDAPAGRQLRLDRGARAGVRPWARRTAAADRGCVRRHHRAQGGGDPPGPSRPARSADRPAQSPGTGGGARAQHRPVAAIRHAAGRAGAGSRRLQGDQRPTTVIPPATRRCSRSPTGCARSSAAAISWRVSAATSSRSSPANSVARRR